MGVRIELADGAIEIQRMREYLFVVERGRLSSAADVRTYVRAVETARDEESVALLVVDARVDPKLTDPAAREAYWDWLGKKPFDRVAIVADDEMFATELNMKALSRKMRVRAFTSLTQARTWVVKPSSSGGRISVMPEPPPAAE